MSRPSPVRLGLAALLLLSLAACDDNPTGAGLDIARQDAGSGAPVRATVAADSLAPASFQDAVGNTGRLLVGASRVPGTYAFTATAFFDLLEGTVTDDFREGTVESATLVFEPAYRFGDTTGTVTLALHNLDEALAVDDTTVAIDPAVGTAPVLDAITFAPTDTLVRAPLGQAWVDAFDETLRSEDFADLFHGFRLAPAQGAPTDAVVGLDVLGLRLEVVAAGDTARFGAGRSVSGRLAVADNFVRFERTGDYAPQPGEPFVVQDGVGTSFTFDLPLPDSLRSDASLNRASVVLPVDTLLNPAAAGFVQPALERFVLYGVTDEGDDAFLAESAVDEEGRVVFSTRTSNTLFFYLRSVLLGEAEPLDHYRIEVPPSVNTVNYALFPADLDDDAGRARLELVFVPLD